VGRRRGAKQPTRPPASEQELAALLDLAIAHRDASVEQAVSALAHELNQPLTAVVMRTRAAMRRLQDAGGADSQAVEALEQAVANAKAAARLVSDFRQRFAVASSRRGCVASIPLIRTAAELARLLASRQGNDVVLETAGELPVVDVAPVRFQQALFNILQERVRVLSESGSRGRRVHVRAAAESTGRLEVVIRTASGARPPERPTQRAPRGAAAAAPDALAAPGLGLGSSRRIVEDYGGALTVEGDEAGEDTVVRIVLPAAGP